MSDEAPVEATPAREGPPPPAAQPRLRRIGFFALAFWSGFAVLTIEIAGARLIAPVFGLSAIPWTAVIGVILGALAVGSHLGGRLADSGAIPLSAILAFAGLTGALPVVGEGFPWMARDVLGFIPGAVASALVLFGPPVLCLGAVVPFLVQADTETLGAVGRRAGDVSAAATAGSIAGTFVTGFVLLPAFPLPVLLGLTAASLFAMAFLSARLLASGGPRGLHLLLAAASLGALGLLAARPTTGTLAARQTLYASVRVTEREWRDGRMVRELFQNGGSSSAEYVDTGEAAHAYVTVSLEVLEPALARTESMLVLGGAALSLPVAFDARRPGMEITVVELDPVVTELAAEHFAYGRAVHPNIHVVHEDARVHLRASSDVYHLVYLDVFDHLLTVPWTMVTREALTDMAARMSADGLFVANVLSPLEGPGVGFLERLEATLDEVFADTRTYLADPGAAPGVTQNLVIVAAKRPGVIPAASRALSPVVPAGRPLTDAWAPVEYLQAKVFLRGLGWR
ncbi:MAG: fused MFS/spermidine synthase [Gemmatimonadales bacterium]